VDPIAVHDIQTIRRGAAARRGIGVLITDHNVEQTLDIVDARTSCSRGEVVQVGPAPVRELVFEKRVSDLYLGPTLNRPSPARLSTPA